MSRILVVEIGSTTTRASVFSLSEPSPMRLALGSAPTSVDQGDVSLGVKEAIRQMGEIAYDASCGASSAAGGLTMSVHGLVYDMTVKAAREAASGAGGNIKMITAGRLDERDLAKLKRDTPKMILIAGGFDYGEAATANANASAIARLELSVPVVYAGNVVARDAVVEAFERAGQRHYLSMAPNVYPSIDKLVVEPVRKIIQDAFERHIVEAPGMDSIRESIAGTILPVPGAVMNAAKLLYDAWGDTLVLDVGGATTDVHSVTEGSEEWKKRMLSPEPTAKRTVEGDLGIYRNKDQCVQLATKDALCRKLNCDTEHLERLLSEYPPVPKGETAELARLLTEEAVLAALSRHAGRRMVVYGPTGRIDLAEGKDLTNIQHLVLTGGALTRLPDPIGIVKAAWKRLDKGLLLPQGEISVSIDVDYVMAICGVLGDRHPEVALRLLQNSLSKGTKHVHLMD